MRRVAIATSSHGLRDRRSCFVLLVGMIVLVAGVCVMPQAASGLTTYKVRITTATYPSSGCGGRLVFDFLSSDPGTNTATITNLSHDGHVDTTETEGGPISGGLVFGGVQSDTTVMGDQYFVNRLTVPFDTLRTYVSFDVLLTESGPADTRPCDQLAVFCFRVSDPSPQPTEDPLGANALFAITATGASGGDVQAFNPGVVQGGDSILVDLDYLCESGGGGCPFLDVQSAGGWREENSILGRSLTAQMGDDICRLSEGPNTVRGRTQVRVRENEQEYTSLDEVHLTAIDHEPGLQSFDLGARVVLGSKMRPFSVTTSDGRDVSSVLTGDGGYFEGAPGDTLYVQWARPSVGFGSEQTMPGEGGGGGGEGGEKEMEKAQAKAQMGPTSNDSGTAADAAILESTGILIQRPDGSGAWRTVLHYYPRAKRAEFAIDSLSLEPVRLLFVGHHRLYSLFRIEASGETAERQLIAPSSAWHSRLGEVRAAVSEAGGAVAALTPGDTITMEFEVPPVPVGKVRDWFFVSRGVYSSSPTLLEDMTENGERALPIAFALRQNHPNPSTERTLIRFELPVATPVRLEVFDALGRRIRTLVNGVCPAGFHSTEWDQRDGQGRFVTSGIYLYRIQAGSFRDQKKMVLLPR